MAPPLIYNYLGMVFESTFFLDTTDDTVFVSAFTTLYVTVVRVRKSRHIEQAYLITSFVNESSKYPFVSATTKTPTIPTVEGLIRHSPVTTHLPARSVKGTEKWIRLL